MATSGQKRKLLKAKIAVALRDELGRVPSEKEIGQIFTLTRVMYKAVLDFTINGKSKRSPDNWLFFKFLIRFRKVI
jgi:hypothetical protein